MMIDDIAQPRLTISRRRASVFFDCAIFFHTVSRMASAMTIHCRRREFMAALGSAAVGWPLATRAQQQEMPLVALINAGSATLSESLAEAFRKGLGKAGYTEGRNVTIEYHWQDGDLRSLPALMADLVRRRVAVIATPATMSATLAAKAATATIPIVFGIAQDPVELGLVMSYSRPGGNATGLNYLNREVDAKRLDVLHQLVPNAVDIAVLIDPRDPPTINETTTQSLQEASHRLGLQIHIINASSSAEIDAAFAAIARDRFDALFVPASTFFLTRRAQVITLAARDGIPASYPGYQTVQAGGLMSYGSDIADVFYEVGNYSGMILNGADPAELPVIQPTRFVLAINLKAARLLGITVPWVLLGLADKLIE
jgi:putative tryptophan/tyrosine transport system substrate-binding protein